MARRSFRGRMMRAMATIVVGGSAFQLSGCDPTVRATLLEGLEATTASLSSALISAFFLSLQDDAGNGSLTTT